MPQRPGQHLHFSPLRRVQQAQDSDGKPYDIMVQDEDMSCGIAASAMLIDLYNGVCSAGAVDAEQRLKAIAAKFPGSLVESDALWDADPNKDREFGSMWTNINSLLNSQNVSTSVDARKSNKVTPVIRSAQLQEPALVLWGWYPTGPTGQRNGGHFTVAAGTTTRGSIVILDPWDGSLSELNPGAIYHGDGYVDVVIYSR